MKTLLITLAVTVSNIFGAFTLNDVYPEVDITVEAPESLDKAKTTEIIFYCLPNGNRIEWTAGKKLHEGDNWHYDIQHISAQTRFMRANDPSKNYVTVYLADRQHSWTTWRKRHADILPETLEAIISDISGLYSEYNPSVTLSSHSGGGYFLFEYIRTAKKINPLIHRFVFIDSVYGYLEEVHCAKLTEWLKDRGHSLCVISYEDSTVIYEGKPLVTKAGGTWGRSHAMVDDLSKTFRFRKKENKDWEIYRALKKRVTFKLLKNPEGTIWHTVLVEKNGYIDSNWAGTKKEGKGYEFWGERAYTKYIPDNE